jgi:hypothetical protein
LLQAVLVQRLLEALLLWVEVAVAHTVVQEVQVEVDLVVLMVQAVYF